MRNKSQNQPINRNSYLTSDKRNKSYTCLFEDITKGLRYSYSRINANTSKTLEATSFLYALIELLDEKGMLNIEELDQRKNQMAEKLVKKFVDSGVGLLYQDPEYDKYTFEHESNLDCLSRLHICKAICCKFPFALSKQDVEEGIIRWDFGRPYVIAQDEDGYCSHLSKKTYLCTVRKHRPVPCRGFDCSNSTRWKVWDDFDNMIINKDLLKSLENNEAS